MTSPDELGGVPGGLVAVEEEGLPEIRKFKKKFNSDVLCASMWGVWFCVVLCGPVWSYVVLCGLV